MYHYQYIHLETLAKAGALTQLDDSHITLLSDCACKCGAIIQTTWRRRTGTNKFDYVVDSYTVVLGGENDHT